MADMGAADREWRDLLRRAHRAGIQPQFTDDSGRRRAAGRDTVQALLGLLESEAEMSTSILPPVIVCWQGTRKRAHIDVSTPERLRLLRSGRFVLVLASEHGGLRRELKLTAQATTGSRAVLELPSLPAGYHDLRFENRAHEQTCLVISAPKLAYARRGRDWGVFVPMYGLRSEESWGAGSFSDWERLRDWLVDVNRTAMGEVPAAGPARPVSTNVVMATLPLLGAFLDDWKCEPSPYSPVTRLFWNEFYLDVTRIPEFMSSRAAQRLASSTGFQGEIRALRAGACVEYRRGAALKRRVLELLADEFFSRTSARRTGFETFCRERFELKRYACFRAATEQRREPWHTWPKAMRRGHLGRDDYDAPASRYHMFVQWLVQEQIEALLSGGREAGVTLYLDLPLGVNADGYDVWAHQDLFVQEASVGAPPDAFFTKGQNWGFPPLHPARIRQERYQYVIDYLRFQMRHTGLLRLDHVMGLHRLWLVPAGGSAADGAYVSYNAEEMYAILSLESHRHQTTLVGENLGTVPPAVNRSLRRHGIRTMYVAQYAARPARPVLPVVPRTSVASLNTHDMPTWASFWEGLDIADRRRLDLVTEREARDQREARRRLCRALAKFLRGAGPLQGGGDKAAVLSALLDFLGGSEAELVLVSLEDLWLEPKPQNTPGTCAERVNWRRKLRKSLSAIRNDRHARRLLRQLVHARAGSPR